MTNILTRRIVFLILLMVSTVLPSLGQGARLELKNLESLKSKANDSTDVTLDGSMLQLATKALENEKDPDAAKIKDVISKLKGVYVKTFEFKEKNQYNNSDLEPIRAQLRDPNWSKVVDVQERESGESTEVYLMKEGESLIGLAVLVAEPQELTVVNIVGPIELDKLGALAGKLGGMMGKFDIGPDGLKLRGNTGKKGSTAKPSSGKASTPAKPTSPATAATPSKPNNEEE
ncbi:MAG TPA: DUF4252 domain-containing protein [Candidatus Angelobacter sp.]|nr:DUF4252 domain-containing protein [Candidatus Angelobacter sp.]